MAFAKKKGGDWKELIGEFILDEDNNLIDRIEPLPPGSRQFSVVSLDAMSEAERTGYGIFPIYEPLAPPPAGQNLAGSELIDYNVNGTIFPLRSYILTALDAEQAYLFKLESLNNTLQSYKNEGPSMAMKLLDEATNSYDTISIPLTADGVDAVFGLQGYFLACKGFAVPANGAMTSPNGQTFVITGSPETNYREDFFYQFFAYYAGILKAHKEHKAALDALFLFDENPDKDAILAYDVTVNWPNFMAELPGGGYMLPSTPQPD